MTLQDAASTKRLILGPVLLVVLFALAHRTFGFAYQLYRQDQEQQQTLRTLERNREVDNAYWRQNRENLERQRLQLLKVPAPARPTGNKSSRKKLAASALVTRLRKVNAFGLVAGPGRLLHCTESRDGWDYTCVFHPDSVSNTSWVQFGVLVDDAHVLEMSEMYPINATLPQPLTPTAR